MKRHYYFKRSFFVLISMLMLSAIAICRAEEITLTTYYPSPYGVYSELRLYPKPDSTTPCDSLNPATQIGLMYYDNTFGEEGLKVCGGNPPAWQSVGGGGYWTLSSNNLYATNTTSWNVGIGTTGPGTKLSVRVDGNGANAVLRLSSILTNWNAGYGPRLLFHGGSDDRVFGEIGSFLQDTGTGANAYMTFSTRNSETIAERIRITSAGNVGIGTASPFGRLEVNQLSTVADPNIVLSQSSSSTGYAPKVWFKRAMNPIGPPAFDYALGSFVYSGYAGGGCVGTCTSDLYARGGRIAVVAAQPWSNVNHGTYMTFEVANMNESDVTEAMRIVPSVVGGIGRGSVGIGTGSPDTTTYLTLGTAGGGQKLTLNDISTARWSLGTGGYSLHIANDSPSAWTDRMVITQAGDIGIGTSPTQKLDVNGKARFRSGIQMGGVQLSAFCSGTPPFSCNNTTPLGARYDFCALTMTGGRDGAECEISDLGGGQWRLDGRNSFGTTVKCAMRCFNYY